MPESRGRVGGGCSGNTDLSLFTSYGALAYDKLMHPIVITGKREWREGNTLRVECYCNGIHLTEKYEGIPDAKARKHMENGFKNMCKIIKLVGNDKDTIQRAMYDHSMYKKIYAVDLPEWE